MDEPWKSEPEKVDGVTAEGYRYALRRGPVGHWCGYVGIGRDHSLHGVGYSDPTEMLRGRLEMLRGRLERTMKSEMPAEEDRGMVLMIGEIFGKLEPEPQNVFRVHGGITYAEDHLPQAEPDGLWWYGFDCAHSGDLCPDMQEKYPELYSDDTSIYRDAAYAIAQCARLSAQLKEEE